MRTNLKIFRVMRNLTQEQIAEKMGCSRATFAAIESGKRGGRQNFWKRLQESFNVADEEVWKLMKNESSENNG